MPNTPADSKFLTEEERQYVLRYMRLDSSGATETDVDEERFNWYWVKMALRAPQTYFCAIIWFFLLVPLYVRTCNVFLLAAAIGAPTDLTQELFTLLTLHHPRNGLQVDHRPAIYRAAKHRCVSNGPGHYVLLGPS